MKTSDKGRAFVESQEGLRLEPYLDQLGYPTIGYGHRIEVKTLAEAVNLFPAGITPAEADAFMIGDLGAAEAGVSRYVTALLTQGMFDALVDLCFNAGANCLANTRCLSRLNAGDGPGARAEFLGFCHGADAKTGQRVILPVLARRRQLAAAQLWDQ